MSKIEVNTVEPQCGTTLTLGGSGDTVALGSGASQTGFGASGAVSWNTTKITADPANAVSGTGYFCDTSGSGFTVTLPTGPSAGDIVGLADYNGNFASNNLTVGRNGSNINGDASNFVIAQNNVSAQFIYVDGTEGWRIVFTGSLTGDGLKDKFIVATGGTPCSGAVCGDYKVHTFTGPGTFCVSCRGSPTGSNTADYMVVAGGAGGGSGNGNQGGGGGAGGFRESSGAASGCYTASPLGAGVSALPLSSISYAITVGGGGAGFGPYPGAMPNVVGNPGSSSIFSTITSAGGGGGGTSGNSPPTVADGVAGGSGGGGGGGTQASCGGAGNTPAESPAQGTAGGDVTPTHSPDLTSAGGGGAGAVGANAPSPPSVSGGPGGSGVTTSINFTATGFSGGGGGGAYCGSKGNDHSWPNGRGPAPGVAACAATGFGGGTGGAYCAAVASTAGSTNKGGGGGGSGMLASGGGGSGVVIIRYKFQ